MDVLAVWGCVSYGLVCLTWALGVLVPAVVAIDAEAQLVHVALLHILKAVGSARQANWGGGGIKGQVEEGGEGGVSGSCKLSAVEFVPF
jgi:hypothetical protein